MKPVVGRKQGLAAHKKLLQEYLMRQTVKQKIEQRRKWEIKTIRRLQKKLKESGEKRNGIIDLIKFIK